MKLDSLKFETLAKEQLKFVTGGDLIRSSGNVSFTYNGKTYETDQDEIGTDDKGNWTSIKIKCYEDKEWTTIL